MRLTKAVCAIYVVACLGALFLIPASAHGWLGLAPDSPVVAFAKLLSLPWSLLLAQVATQGVFGTVMLVAAAMALNLALIFAVGRWLARRR